MTTVDTTFAQDIEEAAGDEEIIGCVIGAAETYYDRSNDGIPLNVVIPWAEARKYLDYEYDRGHGCANCHPIFAWTNTYVLSVHEYDGATSITRKPRNPMNCAPFEN